MQEKIKDDTVSRKAALALAKDIVVPTEDGTVYRHRCIDPLQILELPSVQPEYIRCKKCRQGGEQMKEIVAIAGTIVGIVLGFILGKFGN